MGELVWNHLSIGIFGGNPGVVFNILLLMQVVSYQSIENGALVTN